MTTEPAPDPDAPADDERANALANSEPDTEDTGTAEADDQDHFPRDYVNKLRAENKRLREGRTAAETQRDIERARNELRDQREAERIAAEVLIDGADIWRGSIDIAELRDEDGLPDHGKIRSHANTVAQRHQHLRRQGTPAAALVTSDKTPYDNAQSANWQEVLRGGTG